MRIKFLIIILFLFLSVKVYADTHTVAAPYGVTQAQAAINAATAGDSVYLPACNVTWSSTVTINKQLIFYGAGSSSSIINVGATNTPVISVVPTSNVPVRIHSIGFVASNVSSEYVMLNISGVSAYLTQFRLDHCAFTKGRECIKPTGIVWGVIDNNTFTNCHIAFYIDSGNGYVSQDVWGDYDIAAGTANALFIENNTFYYDDTIDVSVNLDAIIYLNYGTRVVVRYNTVNATAFTTADELYFLNNHGNGNYYTGGNDMRGSPIFECYANLINAYDMTVLYGIRGGSVLLWNNASTVTNPSTILKLTEEEVWYITPYDTTWPCEDQVFNSFFWGNTHNGGAVDIGDVVISFGSSVTIAENRDFFMHAPQSSGGYEYFTNRRGASGRGADGTMLFSSSGANAYYPYTPYTCPHPLVGSGICNSSVPGTTGYSAGSKRTLFRP